MEKPIPKQEEGSKLDTGERRTFETLEEAKAFFAQVAQKMLDVPNWHQYTGTASAVFHLTNHLGMEKTGEPGEGDYLCIRIPGPGVIAGDGFDWVRVEAVVRETAPEHDEQTLALRVRPSSNPKSTDEDTAHFFTDAATSTFMVERRACTVIASIHGRNEVPNTAEAENVVDKVRNLLVGLPASAGLAHVQWDRLVAGWMRD